MGKDHPEITEIKNICDTSKKPKQICSQVKKAKKKKNVKTNREK